MTDTVSFIDPAGLNDVQLAELAVVQAGATRVIKHETAAEAAARGGHLANDTQTIVPAADAPDAPPAA